jgi:phage tail-like protein
VQATFGDVTLSRGVDKQGALWNWISKIAQKQPSADTVKKVTLMACDSNGDPIQSWTLMNAYPSSYQAAGMAASGVDVLTESISIHYTDAQLDEKGGLTGSVDG